MCAWHECQSTGGHPGRDLTQRQSREGKAIVLGPSYVWSQRPAPGLSSYINQSKQNPFPTLLCLIKSFWVRLLSLTNTKTNAASWPHPRMGPEDTDWHRQGRCQLSVSSPKLQISREWGQISRSDLLLLMPSTVLTHKKRLGKTYCWSILIHFILL